MYSNESNKNEVVENFEEKGKNSRVLWAKERIANIFGKIALIASISALLFGVFC